MATISKRRMEWVGSTVNSYPSTMPIQEGASQAYKVGEVGYINDAGQLAEIGGNTPAQVYGMANKDASGTQGTEQTVTLLDDHNLFELNVLQASLADHVLAQTDIGTVMGVQRDTTNNILFANASTKDGANARIFVHKVAKGSAIGDTNARVVCSWLQKFVQHKATS